MSVSAPTSAPTAAPAMKWMWAAIGALGVSVLALGATLVLQQRAPSAPVPVAAGPDTAQFAMSPDPQALALASNAPPAVPEGAAKALAPAAATLSGLRPLGASPRPEGGQMVPAAGAVEAPVARAPVCASCGRVESVQAVEQAEPATGVGAVAGGVLGAVVGNQVGKGSGRTAATLLGAAGGGYVGHKIEQRTRTRTVYQVAVRMDNGSVRHFQRAQPTAVGTPVVLQGKGFRVDQGSSARGPDAYPQAQQPRAIRVSETY